MFTKIVEKGSITFNAFKLILLLWIIRLRDKTIIIRFLVTLHL